MKPTTKSPVIQLTGAILKRMRPPLTDLTDPKVRAQVEEWFKAGWPVNKIRRALRCGKTRYYKYFSKRGTERCYIGHKGKMKKARALLISEPTISNVDLQRRTGITRSQVGDIRRALGIQSPEYKAVLERRLEQCKLALRVILQNPGKNFVEWGKIAGLHPYTMSKWYKRYKNGEFNALLATGKAQSWLTEPVHFVEPSAEIKAFWDKNGSIGLQLGPEEYERYLYILGLRRRGLQYYEGKARVMHKRQGATPEPCWNYTLTNVMKGLTKWEKKNGYDKYGRKSSGTTSE